MEPTFKNMLLTQINRLGKSPDPLDKYLRNYLISVLKDRGFQQKGWMADIEEVEQIHRMVKKGESVSSAAAVVAKNSSHSQRTLDDKYTTYKDALIEIDQIFQELRSRDAK